MIYLPPVAESLAIIDRHRQPALDRLRQKDALDLAPMLGLTDEPAKTEPPARRALPYHGGRGRGRGRE